MIYRYAAIFKIIGILFTWASYEFIYDISNYVLGGWLFLVSSIIFMYVDFVNWWINNRVGCCCYSIYLVRYEEHVHELFQPQNTLIGKLQRAENGIIGIIALSASVMFTVGSYMFIPSVDLFDEAIIIFIIGSLVIALIQLWLMLKHWNDVTLRMLHFWGVMCGVFYLIGSIWFLPAYNVAAADTNAAAGFFIAGGVSFLFVGIIFTYRMFFLRDLRLDYRESIHSHTWNAQNV